MATTITLRKAGGSISATLPKSVVERLNVAAGDTLYLIETDRGILLSPYDPNFDDAITAFRQVRKQFRNTLRKLAE